MDIRPAALTLKQISENPEFIKNQIKDYGFLIVDPGARLLEVNKKTIFMAQNFFDLAEKAKEIYKGQTPGGVGYFPFRYEKAMGEIQPDEKEFWHSQISSFENKNLWPLAESGWFQLSKELFNESLNISRLISQKILEAYDIAFNDKLLEGDWSTLRQINYPSISQDQSLGDMAATHTGIQFLGLQWPATEKGLEFYTPEAQWVTLPNYQSLLTVNMGETLEVYSQGLIKATKHRVRRVEGIQRRQSNVFFFHAHPESKIIYNDQEMSVNDWVLKRVSDISNK